ncbi:MAG: insulinase family protein, partial [Chitinophagaceae bacterium]
VLGLFACHGSTLQAQTYKPYDMMVSGVKVIVHPARNKIILVKTFLDGGVSTYPPAKAGLEYLTLTAQAECGTLKDNKNSFKGKLNNVNAQITAASGSDYSSLALNCIDSDFDIVFPLYADAINIPAFTPADFLVARQNHANFAKLMETFPDQAITDLAYATAFAGKPYATSPYGDSASISSFSVAQVREHWRQLFTKSRMVIVVVADLPEKKIREALTPMLAKIPVGKKPVSTTMQKSQPVVFPSNTIRVAPKKLETNYLYGITGAPSPGSPDYDAYAIAIRMFSDRQFLEIRSKNGLSYDPSVRLQNMKNSFTAITASTGEPDKFIVLTRQLIDSINKTGFTAVELQNKKSGYLTEEYMNMESNERMASLLGRNELVNGNWRRALTLKDDISKVGVNEVNAAFKKYISRMSWVYLGNPEKVNPELFKQEQTPRSAKKAF